MSLRSSPGFIVIGRDASTGPVTITAGNQLSLLASPQTGVFAELRSGGAMTITAPTVLVQSTAQAPALVRAVGSSLTVDATTGTFNGALQSTANTLLTGGAFTFTVAPTLDLAPNSSFTLAAGASISSTVGLSIQTAGTGDIILNGPVSGTTLTADSADEMVIGAAINMSGAGNAIVLHGGRRIVNNAGASPLNAPNGRWLAYSVSPFDDIGWELLNPDAPNLYGRSFGFFPPVSAPGTGNRRIYSFTPVLTYTADSGSRTYGGANPALGVTITGLVPGDDLADAVIGTPTLTSLGLALAAPAGSYATVPGGVTATEQGYAIAFVNGVLTVTPAPLTVTAESLSKVYGDPDPALTFAVSGLVLGETPGAVLTGALARAAGETVAGGPYAIGQGTLAATANYALSFVPGTFTITPAPLSIAALAQSKTYGDPDPALTFAATGFRLGDTVASLSGSLARDPGETAGGYAIRLGTLANPNYAIDFTGATFTISPALLRIIAAAQTREYGLPDPVLTFAATGFRFQDTAASVLTGGLARAAGETVGIYAITQGTLAATPNYLIDFTGANLAITPAPLEVVANPQTKVYGDPDPALTFAATGFRLGDTAAGVLSGALARAAGETVAGGPYAIVQGTLAANPNYAIRFTGAGLAISPRPLSVALIGTVGRIYDATTLAPVAPGNFQLTGVLAGDAVGVVAADARYDTPNVGTGKLVTATGLSLTGAAAGNYSLAGTVSAAIGTITPAPLTAVALDAVRPFGLPNPPFQLQLTGLRGSDTAASIGLSATSEATPRSPPGFYAIEVVGSPLNYIVTRVPGTLTVLPVPAFGRSAPEPVAVPALGGLVQQGVATGVHALNDTLDLRSGMRAAPLPLLRSSRYTVAVQPSLPPPGGLGGASAFDGGAIRP